MSRSSGFLERQRRFFAEADTGHFRWQTENPYFARTERDLLRGFPVAAGTAVLEVGCGEGANLVHLAALATGPPRLLVGADLFERKLAFARVSGVPGRLVCADALGLPFPAGAFDAILCRDLLHHLEDPGPALAELRRVVRPGGTVWVVEPNGRNPLVQLLALLRPHERGQLRGSVEGLRALAARHFRGVEIELRQPLPVYRMLLHHRFGLPRLGHWRSCGAALDALDRGLHTLWPRGAWAYVVARLEP